MNNIRKLGLIIALLLPLVACDSDSSNPVARVTVAEVGSIADARFETGYSLDGDFMLITSAKLLEPSNFSLNGTVATAIKITDTAINQGDVTVGLLSNFDIFFIGWLADASPNAFTAAELTAFQDWVAAGGIMIVTCDDPEHDAVCEAFGYPSTEDALEQFPTVPTTEGVMHPLFNGAFGEVAEIALAGRTGFFQPLAVNDTAMVLGQVCPPQADCAATILEKQIGAGWVIFLSDVDMITDNTLSDGTTITTDNDRFLANLFAYLTGKL